MRPIFAFSFMACVLLLTGCPEQKTPTEGPSDPADSTTGQQAAPTEAPQPGEPPPKPQE